VSIPSSSASSGEPHARPPSSRAFAWPKASTKRAASYSPSRFHSRDFPSLRASCLIPRKGYGPPFDSGK
jgi:hypothetical protein